MKVAGADTMKGPLSCCQPVASIPKAGLTLVTGPTGTGKTHLLSGLERQQRQACPPGRVLSLSAADLIDRLVAALRREAPEDFRGLPDQGHSLVLIDDLDTDRIPRRTAWELARLFEAFYFVTGPEPADLVLPRQTKASRNGLTEIRTIRSDQDNKHAPSIPQGARLT